MLRHLRKHQQELPANAAPIVEIQIQQPPISVSTSAASMQAQATQAGALATSVAGGSILQQTLMHPANAHPVPSVPTANGNVLATY